MTGPPKREDLIIYVFTYWAIRVVILNISTAVVAKVVLEAERVSEMYFCSGFMQSLA
jgi:hypothetical protein